MLPLFVRSGRGVRIPVSSMPGVAQTSVDELLRDAEAALAVPAADGGGATLHGLVLDLEGARAVRGSEPLDGADPMAVGARLAASLIEQGADEILLAVQQVAVVLPPQPE